MDVADDTLTGRDSHSEPVPDRVARLIARDHGVSLSAQSLVAEGGVRAGVDRRSVVGVDHVAGGAAAGSIVAGMVVGPEEVERRVEQAGLLQADEDRVGAVAGPQSAGAQPGAGLAGVFKRVRNADLLRVAPATLEDPQDVPRLRHLEPRQRVEERHHGLPFHLERGRRWDRLEPLRGPVHAVAFAESRRLERDRAVIVQGRAPEHRAVGHHALAHLEHLVGVAVGRAATQVGDSQVAGIDEPDELGRLVIQERVRPDRVAGTAPGVGESRPDMGVLQVGRPRVAAMTVHAAEPDRLRLAVGLVLSPMARHAAGAPGGCLLGRLPGQIDALELGRNGERHGRSGCGGPCRGWGHWWCLGHRLMPIATAGCPEQDGCHDEDRQGEGLARSQARRGCAAGPGHIAVNLRVHGLPSPRRGMRPGGRTITSMPTPVNGDRRSLDALSNDGDRLRVFEVPVPVLERVRPPGGGLRCGSWHKGAHSNINYEAAHPRSRWPETSSGRASAELVRSGLATGRRRTAASSGVP